MQEQAEETQAKEHPFIPSEEWIEAFEKQATAKDFEVKLLRFAKMRARMVAHAGRVVDELYARDLVQDALADTLGGVIAWAPERVDLVKHVFDAIKSRTRHDYLKARRRPHQSFDMTTSASAKADAATSLAAHQEATVSAEVAATTMRVLDELRCLAASDADVLAMLDAYEQEATKKVDVLLVSGLSAKTYEAARKRMHRLVLQLPTDVRETVRA